MPYRKYGSVFRELREQKNLSLSFFEKLGISKSSISKFERGESLMALERVDIMLQEMDVSLSEYEWIVNCFVPNFQEAYLSELECLEYLNDIEGIVALKNEATEGNYYWLELVCKSKLEQLSDNEVKKIFQFIISEKQWGYFEFCLIHSILDQLETDHLKLLLQRFKQKQRKNYFEILKYQRKNLQWVYRSVLVLSARGEQELANDTLNITETTKKEKIDFYCKVLRGLAEGFYFYCFEDNKKGIDKMNEAFSLFEKLGSVELKKYYESRIEKYKKIRESTVS